MNSSRTGVAHAPKILEKGRDGTVERLGTAEITVGYVVKSSV